jgi:hypothetical protein
VDLFDLVKSCIRRWYIVIPLLIVAAWYSHHVYASVKPVYYSSAVIGVTPPNSRIDQAAAPGDAVPRNGLLDVGGASLITNMATLALGDSGIRTQVVASGGAADYTVKMFPVPATMPELPMIMVEATEPDPLTASKTVESVVGQAGSTLRALQQQAGVPDDQMVTPFVVSPQSGPWPGMPSRTRSTIAVFVALAGAAVLAGLLTDVLLSRWSARRRRNRPAVVNTDNDRVETAEESTDARLKNNHAVEEVTVNR